MSARMPAHAVLSVTNLAQHQAEAHARTPFGPPVGQANRPTSPAASPPVSRQRREVAPRVGAIGGGVSSFDLASSRSGSRDFETDTAVSDLKGLDRYAKAVARAPLMRCLLGDAKMHDEKAKMKREETYAANVGNLEKQQEMSNHRSAMISCLDFP